MQVAIATTDIETGELVTFDTARGAQITIDHLLASCGFLPEFAPVEIDGRLLGDGGLSANAPIEAVTSTDDPVFVVDLFARDGGRPDSLEEALARKNDLLFGNQTLRYLETWAATNTNRRIMYLSYRPNPDEAGPEKTFDLSRRSIEGRWQSGLADMKYALTIFSSRDAQAVTMVRRAA